MKRTSLLMPALLLLATSQAMAQVIVVPNGNANTPGNTDNRFPFFVTGGQRVQQIYGASAFSSLSSPELITAIAFRPSQFVSEAFTTTISDIQIDMSTVNIAPDGLSPIFANNVGANDTVVYGAGPLTISSSDTQGVFDTVIDLQTPFLYNPAAGSLLLDIRNFSGADPSLVGSEFLDAENVTGDAVSRVYGSEGNEGAASGSVDSLGLITQFTFQNPAAGTPEPGSLALFAGMGFTGMGLMLRRRLRK